MSRNKSELVVTDIKYISGGPLYKGRMTEFRGHIFPSTDSLIDVLKRDYDKFGYQLTLHKETNEVWVHDDTEKRDAPKVRRKFLEHVITVSYSHENVAHFNGFREYKNVASFILLVGILADAMTRFNLLEMGAMAALVIMMNKKSKRKDLLKRRGFD